MHGAFWRKRSKCTGKFFYTGTCLLITNTLYLNGISFDLTKFFTAKIMTPLKLNHPVLAIFCSILIVFASCTGDSKDKGKYKNSDMYDFASPMVIDLPVYLDEISGLAYYPKDTSVFGVIDEDGILFKIPIMDPSETTEWVFDKPRDFEDLILVDSTFYALVSNGDIVRIDFQGDSIHTQKAQFSSSSGKKTNEFESIYEDAGKIVIMCKECEDDKKSKVSTYIFDPVSLKYSEHISISMAPIAKRIQDDKLALKASAAAKNPITKDLYLVSSIEKVIVILDSTGTFKELYKLNPKIYKQPEGISFTPAGDLIISNEVFLEGNANLLILKNKKK